MSLARRIWKWSAATLAVLAVVCALLVGVLRLWLENSPSVSEDVVARVEAVTGLRLRFERLDATVGWHGPELVFRQARILAKANGATVVTARAGRVGFDVWRAISTGRLASARIELDGAVVHVLVLPTGIELLGQEALRRGETDSTPLEIRNLPVGRVRLVDGVIVVEDRRRARSGFTIDHVRLDLDRDPSRLDVAALVKLPASLGQRLEASGRVDGSGGEDSPLVWTATAQGRGLRFQGLSDLLGEVVRLPLAGAGDVKLDLAGTGLVLGRAQATLALKDLVLPPLRAEGPRVAGALSGTFALERMAAPAGAAGATFRVRARDVSMLAGNERWERGLLDAEWRLDAGGLAGLTVRVGDLPFGALTPFAALAPSPGAREAAADLAPAGRLQRVDLGAVREAGRWTVRGSLAFQGLAVGAYRAVPGIGPLDGSVSASGDHGTVRVSARAFTLNLARYLRTPVGGDSLEATIAWTHEADGWHLACDGARVVAPDVRGDGLVRLWIPPGGEPPHLVLDLALRDAELRGLSKYLPGLRLPVDAMNWLDHAFLAGRLDQARLQYVGPTEGFPFHDGRGLFLVEGGFSGARVHYADDWSDLEDVAGDLQIGSEGFRVQTRSGHIGGLALGPGVASMADFRDADLVARGSATGDLHRALRLVQASPVGKSLGGYFSGIDGHGASRADVDLYLPLRHFGDRRVSVDARVEHATAKLPGVQEEVSDLDGRLLLRNLDIEVPSLTATAFGGPLVARVTTRAPRGDEAGLHTTTVDVQGHALAARLQPQFGITRGTWLAGEADWRLTARLQRLSWMRPLPPRPPQLTPWAARETAAGRPPPRGIDDHPAPPRREPESRLMPVSLHFESALSGLEVRFPAPLAKAAAESRRLRVDVEVDPGVREGDAAPPPALAGAEEPRPMRINVQAALGPDSLRAVFAPGAGDDADAGEGSAPALRHATVHFGNGAAHLREEPGVWLEGRVPRFDLSAWLRLDTSDEPGRPLYTWLKGGEVTVDHFAVLGFELRDVVGGFAASADAWRVHAAGPQAQGTVVVPYDLRSGRPIELEFARLVLNERSVETAPGAPRDPPASLPALSAHIDSFEFMKRRLGETTAVLSRIDGGLKLEHADLKAPSFTVHATGRWTGEGDAELCELDATGHSTDLRETLMAFAFEPSATGASADGRATLRWRDGLDATILERMQGRAHVQVKDGQIVNVQPGAGRVFGLMSVANLPRRLALDFHDLTDKGFAFDSLQGDFEFRDGNAYTNNVVVKGPAADIGIVGRTGFKAQDYDQIAVVTAHVGDGLAAAGTLVGGPVIGGALFLFGKVFQGAVEGIARGYYRITGTWDKPRVDSIGSSAAQKAEEGSGALDPAQEDLALPPVAPPGAPAGPPPQR